MRLHFHMNLLDTSSSRTSTWETRSQGGAWKEPPFTARGQMCPAGSSRGDERSAAERPGCGSASWAHRRAGTGAGPTWTPHPSTPCPPPPPVPALQAKAKTCAPNPRLPQQPQPQQQGAGHLSRTNSAQAAAAAAQGAKETREAPGHAGNSNRDFACSVARYSYGSGGCSSACDTSPARRRRRISHGRRSVRLLSRPKSLPAGDRQPTHLSFPS